MNITVTVNLQPGETIGHTSDELAAAVLDLAGGDPSLDACSATIVTHDVPGYAGFSGPLAAEDEPPAQDEPPA